MASTMAGSEYLLGRWRELSAEQAWTFPSDWACPAVEAVCDAFAADEDVWPAGERLGRERAAAGVPLAEALADVDALVPLIDPRYTESLRRAVSLGWADRITAPPAAVTDPLSGLVTPEFLKVRLGEVYRAAQVAGRRVSADSALVVVRLDLSGCAGWQAALPMILAANSMRTVFDGGQTLAKMGPSVAVALTARDALLARRARLLVTMVNAQLAADPLAAVPEPQVWIEPLPAGLPLALELLGELGR